MNDLKDKLLLTFSVVIFGTVGILRQRIPLPSGFVSCIRGALGGIFLLLFLLIRRQKADKAGIKKNLLKLILSGVFIGCNWILLFESIKYCGVATATLCYYMAPVILILVSPIIFSEKLTLKKLLCVLAAFTGIVLVSDFTSFSLSGNGLGVVLGLGAAVLYAGVIIINKTIKDINPFDKTIIQLFSASVIAGIYSAFAEQILPSAFTPLTLVLLLVIGLLHTGIAYAIYFGVIERIATQTVAVMSYIDPVVAVVLSALLGENLGIFGIIGSVLIIGSSIISARD